MLKNFDFNFGSQSVASAGTRKLTLLKTNASVFGHAFQPVQIELATMTNYTVPAAAAGFDIELWEVTATGSNKLLDLGVFITAGDITTDFTAGTRKIITIDSFESGANRLIADSSELELRIVNGDADDVITIGLYGTLWMKEARAGV